MLISVVKKYPRDGICYDFASNDYLDQYRDLKLFYEEDVGEELLIAFISYTVMKTKNRVEVIDLRYQVDHFNPKKFQLLEEYRGATNNARLFMILIRHKES